MTRVSPCPECKGKGWSLNCYTVDKDHDSWPAIKFRRDGCDSCGGTGLANDDDAESIADRRPNPERE